MKKRNMGTALLLSLAMVTGGVYGAWTYYEDEVTKASTEAIKPGMTITPNGAVKGAITLENKGLAISIEPQKDITNYTATTKITGSIIATYTPTENNNMNFNGISAKIEVTDPDNAFNSEKVIIVDTTEKTLTIDNANIGITIADMVFDTKAKADTYKTKLDKVSITITFSEKAA